MSLNPNSPSREDQLGEGRLFGLKDKLSLKHTHTHTRTSHTCFELPEKLGLRAMQHQCQIACMFRKQATH